MSDDAMTRQDQDAARLRALELGVEDETRVLVVSRIHVSRMGAEIWKVTEDGARGSSEFESSEKDAASGVR